MTRLDISYMARALQLAAHPLVSPHPNPRVGCVLVKDEQIVGQGYHDYAGGPHAEVNALQQAGQLAAGCTVYVTLEPCCFTGKTPPCTKALIDAGVKRVVMAMEDPNPQVAGQGMLQLQQAGIECEVGLLRDQALALNKGFVRRMAEGMPWVSGKMAMSLDGRTAMASGESKWITSSAAREDVHRMRARAAAIMTGVGTVLADDPALTARPSDQVIERQPLRVVLDSGLRISSDANIFAAPGQVVLFYVDAPAERVQALQDHAFLHQLPAEEGRFDVKAVFKVLTEQYEINDIMVEAGATLNGNLLENSLLDEIFIYMAPVIMGNESRALFHLPGLQQMQNRIKLNIVDMRAIGPDWRIQASLSE